MHLHQTFGALALFVLLAASSTALAEPRFVLRMATIAPEGTAWAREFNAFSRDVETSTRGEVRIKWYFGGIAGGELEVADRIGRGQLDGTASGGMLCMRAAPAMRVMRVRGVFASRDEAAHVMNRLKPLLDEQFRKSGFVHLATTGLGPDVIFSRRPVRDLADLQKTRMWRWDLDQIAILTDHELGYAVVPLPIDQAAQAYDEGKVDGFFSVPTAALAFQWYTRAHYLLDLPMGFLWGCMIVTDRAFDRLPVEHQRTLLAASAKIAARFESVGRQQDHQLMNGLFQKQGLTALPVSAELRSALLSSARAARERLGDKLVPAELLQKVLAILADYRGEHQRPTE